MLTDVYIVFKDAEYILCSRCCDYVELCLCLDLFTSLDVIELRLWGGIILRRRRGGLDPGPGLGGGPELRAGLAGPNRLLLDPGLDLTAALRPET